MRDLRKIKSKYEFKLDNKQIAFLLLGVLVVLVVVFALGVVVGKGLVQIQSIESGAELQAQVEENLTQVPDFNFDEGETVTPGQVAEPTPEPAAETPMDEDGFVNILQGQTAAESATPVPVAETPAVEATPVPASPPPPPPSQGHYTIQLSSHPSKAEAENARVEYMGKGLADAYFIKAQVKGSTWWRVRTGSFATKQGAEEFASAIKTKGIVADPWVTTK